MDWIKNENGSFDIVYFGDEFIIQTEQYFDNENFYIQFKTVTIRHNTLCLILFLFIDRMKIIIYFYKYQLMIMLMNMMGNPRKFLIKDLIVKILFSRSLKCVDKFISEIESQIDEFSRRKQEMIKNTKKYWDNNKKNIN
jgi:hypothetical protein